MRKKLLFAFVIVLYACGTNEAEADPAINMGTGQEMTELAQKTSPLPVNSNATDATKALYQKLRSVYGHKAVSGVVANVDWNIREAENVHKWTGKWPVINVFDFINIHASKDVNPKGWLDYSDMTHVDQWHQLGGIVGCMWHWQVAANNGTDKTCSPGTKPGETSFDASQVYVEDTEENKQAIHDLDQVAGYLKTMQRKGIPVIWRPLHEAAGNTYDYEGGGAWFWWGGQRSRCLQAIMAMDVQSSGQLS